MTSPFSFKIDNQDFFCDPVKGDLTIQSILGSYSVSINDDNNPFLKIIECVKKNPNAILIIDEKITTLYKPDFHALEKIITKDRCLILSVSEQLKTWEGFTRVLDFFQQKNLTKSEKVIVVGGGIVQDVAAFSCAIYKRGLQWIYFPTTLLSMCDSCIGGKASINFKGAKNQLGLFSTPAQIFISTAFLSTLSEIEMQSGLGEILKSCCIGGKYALDFYQAHKNNFRELILLSLRIKKAVIEFDEQEANHRRSLNVGHTVGHAVEAVSDYAIPHGIAIVMGMMIENQLSCHRGLLSQSDLVLINRLCADLLSTDIQEKIKAISWDTVLDVMQQDKKAQDGGVYFALLKAVGETVFVKINLDEKFKKEIIHSYLTLYLPF